MLLVSCVESNWRPSIKSGPSGPGASKRYCIQHLCNSAAWTTKQQLCRWWASIASRISFCWCFGNLIWNHLLWSFKAYNFHMAVTNSSQLQFSNTCVKYCKNQVPNWWLTNLFQSFITNSNSLMSIIAQVGQRLAESCFYCRKTLEGYYILCHRQFLCRKWYYSISYTSIHMSCWIRIYLNQACSPNMSSMRHRKPGFFFRRREVVNAPFMVRAITAFATTFMAKRQSNRIKVMGRLGAKGGSHR